MSVVVPARDCQVQLDLTCAALAAQTHPAPLVELLIVDDGSEPPLTLPHIRPTNTRIIRAGGSGHGSGRARDAGAREAEGEVVLFLDADIIVDASHVAAHARWHELTDDAVVLGTRQFADTSALTPAQVFLEVAAADLQALTRGLDIEPHAWIEDFWELTDDLTVDREDLWRPIVGASVSVGRKLYRLSGGFAHFERRGIVDTEFGFRCFTAGGVIIPERAARSLHQGPRAHASRGREIGMLRAPLVANHIANRRYRSPVPGRQWANPYLHVIVAPSPEGFFGVELTVEDLLANQMDDLSVSVVRGPTGGSSDVQLFDDCWGADGRVRLVDEEMPDSGFPSPWTAVVPPGVRASTTAVGSLLDLAVSWQHGLITVAIEGSDRPVELWATRALMRSRRRCERGGLRATGRDLFGELFVAGADFGFGLSSGGADRYSKGGQYYAGRR